MASDFAASPDELRRVSRDLHDVSSAMKAVLSTLRTQLAAEGPVWGGGDIGHQFADGPTGYLAQLDWVNGSIDAKTRLLDDYSALLKQAADAFEQSDQSGSSAAAPGTLATGQAGALSVQGVAGSVPAGASAGTNRADAAVTTGVGSSASVAGSPATATGPSAGAGVGGSSLAGGPATGSSGGAGSGGAPSQNDPAGEDSGSSGATPAGPATAGLPDDAVPSGVDSGTAETTAIDASTPEGAPDPSIISPDTAAFTDAANPALSDSAAPPIPPALPNPPASPTPRRPGAPDDPSSASPDPATDGRSRPAEPSAAPRAEPGAQPTGSARAAARPAGDAGVDGAAQNSSGPPARSRSVTGRAGAVRADPISSEGVARARRGGPDPSRKSGVTGDEAVAPNSGGEREPDEGSLTPEQSAVHARSDATDIASDGDADDIAPAAAERPVSGREDSADP